MMVVFVEIKILYSPFNSFISFSPVEVLEVIINMISPVKQAFESQIIIRNVNEESLLKFI